MKFVRLRTATHLVKEFLVMNDTHLQGWKICLKLLSLINSGSGSVVKVNAPREEMQDLIRKTFAFLMNLGKGAGGLYT